MNESKLQVEEKWLKDFVDSMEVDEPEDKSTEDVETEKRWLKQFVDECNPEEVTWLKRFVDSMNKPEYKKDIHDFVDNMEQ